SWCPGLQRGFSGNPAAGRDHLSWRRVAEGLRHLGQEGDRNDIGAAPGSFRDALRQGAARVSAATQSNEYLHLVGRDPDALGRARAAWEWPAATRGHRCLRHTARGAVPDPGAWGIPLFDDGGMDAVLTSALVVVVANPAQAIERARSSPSTARKTTGGSRTQAFQHDNPKGRRPFLGRTLPGPERGGASPLPGGALERANDWPAACW